MNQITARFFSEALGKHVTYAALLPDAQFGDGPFPFLLQLHGLSDDYRAWIDLSCLTRHVSQWPFIVLLPDGGTSFWMNYNAGAKYEDFVIHDLLDHARRTFRIADGPGAIGGLSMGGYGTLRLALKFPELFASAWGHSSATLRGTEFSGNFQMDPADLDDADLFEWAEKRRDAILPVLSFDCGVDDFLIENNRSFHRHLDELGIPHNYTEHPGAHTWDYWDVHVQEALAKHAEVLGLKPLRSGE